MAKLDDLAERVDRLVLRHQELKRSSALVEQQLRTVTAERDSLRSRLAEGAVRELILATNPTVEGAATAHYIGEMAREYAVVVTRIAHGVPLGGELDYVDGGTLAHAFAGRHRIG